MQPIIASTTATAGKNILLILLGPIIIIAGFVFYIWMLVDVIQRPLKNKALWFIVVFFLWVLGAVIYYFLGRKPSAGKK